MVWQTRKLRLEVASLRSQLREAYRRSARAAKEAEKAKAGGHTRSHLLGLSPSDLPWAEQKRRNEAEAKQSEARQPSPITSSGAPAPSGKAVAAQVSTVEAEEAEEATPAEAVPELPRYTPNYLPSGITAPLPKTRTIRELASIIRDRRRALEHSFKAAAVTSAPVGGCLLAAAGVTTPKLNFSPSFVSLLQASASSSAEPSPRHSDAEDQDALPQGPREGSAGLSASFRFMKPVKLH